MPQPGSYRCPPPLGRTTRRYKKERSEVNADTRGFGAWASGRDTGTGTWDERSAHWAVPWS